VRLSKGKCKNLSPWREVLRYYEKYSGAQGLPVAADLTAAWQTATVFAPAITSHSIGTSLRMTLQMSSI
jgi:hypothetical protein